VSIKPMSCGGINMRMMRFKIMDISKKGLEIISRKIIRLAGKLYGRPC